MKKALCIMATAAVLTTAAASMAGAETVLQLGTTVNEQDSFQVAAEKFAELVEEKTGGEYKIEIYPNGTLGGESDMLDSMSMGMLDMGIITAGPFVNFSEMMGVLDMPFLFANNEEAYKILDGEVGKELLDTLEDAGLKGLAYAERGFRNITNSVRPVEKAEDVAGLKLRVMENKYHLATFEAFGASPTPMAFAEVYTALQTKQIDGQDNPITITCTSKFYEVQKYYSLIEDLFCGNCVVVNAAWFHSLPESYQTALREAAHDMIVEQRRLIDENEAGYIEEMEAGGCAVNELTAEQKQVFADATQSVRDMFVEEFGEEGTKMLELAEKYK